MGIAFKFFIQQSFNLSNLISFFIILKTFAGH